MSKFKSIILAFLALAMSFNAIAQNMKISGKVSDISNNPLGGVTIYIKGTTENTSTDLDGNYTIKAKNGQTIVYSFIGFIQKTMLVSDKSIINIVLEEDKSITALDEIMVVGYGSQSKRTVTSSIAKVSGDEIRKSTVTSAADALKGKVAGARIYTTNNTPGAEPTILIRGGSSISGSNSPLILVDGIERDLSGINPNDIESMEVLKDAASSAIYGSRASNGVVLVTTKKGATSAPQITFQADFAMENTERNMEYLGSEEAITIMRKRISQGPHPNYLTANNYAYSSGNLETSKYSTRALKAGESVPAGYLSMDDPINPGTTLIFQDNSWVKESFKNALWQNYYIGINGGTENVNYLASVGYTDDQGVAIGTNFRRFSARTNVDVKINKKLTFKGGFDFNQNKTNQYASQYQVITRGMMTPTTQKLYYDAGTWAGTPTPGYNASSPTPVFYSYYNDNDQKINKLGLNGTLEYEIIKDLKAIAQLSMFNQDATGDYFTRANIFNGSRPSSSNLTSQDRQKIEVYFAYNKSFGEHSLSATAGYSYQKYNYKYLNAAAADASSDKIPTLNAGPTKTDASTIKEKEVMIGYFGRLQYDYKKRYMLMLTFREDGSSKFASGEQWGFLPGASAGWAISEESFMKGIKSTVNNLKLRISYGKTGNNYIGYYDALGKYAISTMYDGGASIVPSSMPNKGLTWETSTQIDVGIDLGMFNNRFQATVDYYNKITDNLITSKVLPNTSGFGSILTNLGKVKFYGFDIELNSKNIVNKDFTWSTKFVWSFVKNEVLKLPDNGRDKNRIGGYTVTMKDGSKIEFGGTAEGEPLGRFYGYQTDYIIANQSQADNALYDSQSRGWDWTKKGYVNGTSGNSIGKKAIGDYEWKDLNGDGKIDGSDMYLLGNTLPTSTGGLGNTFTYKNLALNIYVDWALGHSISNNLLQRQMCNFFGNNTSLPTEIRKTWDPESGQDVSDAKYARFGGNDSDDLNKNFRPNSNVFTTKGDYLCLRDISLQYTLSNDLLKRAKISNIIFTVSGNNLHYFTKVIGMSPETGTENAYSSSFYTYPPIRRISFGIKLTF